MFLSQKHKFIFIHIPKTGGTSVRTTLANIDPGCKAKTCFLHSNYNYSKAYVDNSNMNWDDFYKFSIVRNPYKRMVSYFQHMTRIREDHKKIVMDYAKLRSELKPTDKKYDQKVFEYDNILVQHRQFVQQYPYTTFDHFIKNPYYYMIDLNIRKIDFTANQIDWLNDGNGGQVDYIMQLERIGSYWEELLETLNIPYTPCLHVKKGNYKLDYRTLYTPELKEIVYNRFKKDFEVFNYDKDLHQERQICQVRIMGFNKRNPK